MGSGGVLAQYATDNTADLDEALRALVGQILGFVLVVVLALWLTRRSRKNRANRPPVSGWYADPWGAPYERWWNGDQWTGNVREQPWPGTYPVPPQVPPYGPPAGPPYSAPHGPPAGPPPGPGGPGGPDGPWGAPPPG